jgi:hypothetical protein
MKFMKSFISLIVATIVCVGCEKSLDQPTGGEFNIAGTVFLVTDSLGVIDTTKISTDCIVRLGLNPLDEDDFILSKSTVKFGYFEFRNIAKMNYSLWVTHTLQNQEFRRMIEINHNELIEGEILNKHIYLHRKLPEVSNYTIEGQLFFRDTVTSESRIAAYSIIELVRTTSESESMQEFKANLDGTFKITGLEFFDFIELKFTYIDTISENSVIYEYSTDFLLQDSLTQLNPINLTYQEGGDLLVRIIDENETPQNNARVCLYSNRISFESDTTANCTGNYDFKETNTSGQSLFFDLPETGRIYLRTTSAINDTTFLSAVDSVDLINSSLLQFIQLDISE